MHVITRVGYISILWDQESSVLELPGLMSVPTITCTVTIIPLLQVKFTGGTNEPSLSRGNACDVIRHVGGASPERRILGGKPDKGLRHLLLLLLGGGLDSNLFRDGRISSSILPSQLY
jgi:hypothetical protein